MAGYRSTTLRQLVVELDPNWVQDSVVVDEYRFSRRTFRAPYGQRGAYHDVVSGVEADSVATANL